MKRKLLTLSTILLISLTVLVSCATSKPSGPTVFSEVIPMPERIQIQQVDDLKGIVLEFTRLAYAYDEIYDWAIIGEKWYLTKETKVK